MALMQPDLSVGFKPQSTFIGESFSAAGLSLRTCQSHVLQAVKPLLSFPSLAGATSQTHPPEIAAEVGKRAQHAVVMLSVQMQPRSRRTGK